MICPKCSFEQPDDIYCAFCGVNIEKYALQKRKKRFRLFLIIFVAGVAALSVAGYRKFGHDAERLELADRDQEGRARSWQRPQVPPEPSTRKTPSDVRYEISKQDRRDQIRTVDRSSIPEGPKDDRLSLREPAGPSLAPQNEQERRGDEPTRAYTAEDWFEKGRAIDDESEAEIECYQNALELDPDFAPAHFRLGAIYYRQANYDLADEAFSEFLEHATEADKEGYNIYVYYSPSDVDRLTTPEKALEPETEEDERGVTTESGEAEESVEAEGGGEAEEAPVEAETETEEGFEEEASEETGEEVNTIVRFLPYDGHIMVPVILNGALEAHVIVDTGSGITVLSLEMARRLGLEGESGQAITLRTMATNIEADLVRLDSIQVGDLVRSNLPVAITALPPMAKGGFDGILGMDFMNRYKIRIDNDNQEIVFSPGRTSQ